MRKIGLIGTLLAATISLSACSTYGDRDRELRGAGTGAAIGAAGGAVAGAVIDGISPVEGAIAGAVAGGIAGAVTTDGDRRWYRDERGNCYYVDDDGDYHYDYDRRC